MSASKFKTVVSKVDKFPLLIVIAACFLLFINFSGLYLFMTNLDGIVPGLKDSNAAAVQQLAYQISARQFIPIVIFVFALFYKDVRVFQVAWVIAFIRETGDLAGALANHPTQIGVGFVIFCMLMEIASFVYLGMIASGKVAKYFESSK